MTPKFTLLRVGSAKRLTLSGGDGKVFEPGSLTQYERIG